MILQPLPWSLAPHGVEIDVGAGRVGEVGDARPVGVDDGAVRAGAPSGKVVTGAREGVGVEVLRDVVGESLDRRGSAPAVGIEIDVVGDGRPVGGVRLVARRARGDRDVPLRRGLPRPSPPREVVAGAGGIGKRDVGALDVVGGRVARAARQGTAVEGVADGVVDGRPGGGVRPVARGALVNGDRRLRRGESRPRPSGEVVVAARRVVQREGGGVHVIGRGIRLAAWKRAVVEGVADGVGVA